MNITQTSFLVEYQIKNYLHKRGIRFDEFERYEIKPYKKTKKFNVALQSQIFNIDGLLLVASIEVVIKTDELAMFSDVVISAHQNKDTYVLSSCSSRIEKDNTIFSLPYSNTPKESWIEIFFNGFGLKTVDVLVNGLEVIAL